MEEQQMNQRQMVVGEHLGGAEKYILELLLRVDKLNAQNLKMYNDNQALTHEVAMLRKKLDQSAPASGLQEGEM